MGNGLISSLAAKWLTGRMLSGVLFGVLLTVAASLPFSVAWAESPRLELLLDAEVDDYINGLAAPVLKAADLSPENVHVLVLNSPEINAFVNSQHTIFMFSGLLLEAENSNEVLGVIAHEVGHLKGHHLLRLSETRDELTFPTIVGGLLGLGAVIAGAPQAGSAVLLGSQAAGISSFLRFSRSQEQQADQIAVNLLDDLNASTEGLKNFFGRLSVQSQMYHQAPPEYLMTHPKPSGRENFLEQAALRPYTPTPADVKAFKRTQAKVLALTHSPGQTRRLMFDRDDGFADYARAIAFFRAGEFAEARQSLQSTAEKLKLSKDPYLTEIKAHMALEKGDTTKAEALYREALSYKPDSTLIRYHYGRTLLVNNKTEPAIAQLERVLQRHGQWWMAHQQLGLAYGKNDQKTAAHIHLAQAALYSGNLEDAGFHIEIAAQTLSGTDTKKQAQQKQTINLLKRELEKLQN